MEVPSKLLSDAVNELSRLPGIGRKTALRLALYLLNRSEDEVARFGEAIVRMKRDTRFCPECHNISDSGLCSICTDKSRKTEMVCVVETIRDVIAIENTNQYSGRYHVLGGIISPLDGIGPEALNVSSLISRIREEKISEVIMALSPTIEGDTTIFYLSRQLAELEVKITTIARGISFGGELEYADELTLARSIVTRMPFESYLVNRE